MHSVSFLQPFQASYHGCRVHILYQWFVFNSHGWDIFFFFFNKQQLSPNLLRYIWYLHTVGFLTLPTNAYKTSFATSTTSYQRQYTSTMHQTESMPLCECVWTSLNSAWFLLSWNHCSKSSTPSGNPAPCLQVNGVSPHGNLLWAMWSEHNRLLSPYPSWISLANHTRLTGPFSAHLLKEKKRLKSFVQSL